VRVGDAVGVLPAKVGVEGPIRDPRDAVPQPSVRIQIPSVTKVLASAAAAAAITAGGGG
jgi:hypothetical protein